MNLERDLGATMAVLLAGVAVTVALGAVALADLAARAVVAGLGALWRRNRRPRP